MTKDEALQMCLEYMNERLEDHDSKFMRHPATEAERDIILANIKEVKEALALTSTECEEQPAQEWSWVCNECGAKEFTSALSEADLEYLACSGCGGNEFHKEALAPTSMRCEKQPAQEFPVNWASMIHYPDCWDTAAYPELRDAIHEVLAWGGCSVCKAQPAQEPVAKPYAYEFARDNGDGTYSVFIERGDLIQIRPTVYEYARPKNVHKDHPIKELFDHPPAAPDWKDQYEKQKRRTEMWIAKYEKDIGPLEKAAPVAQEPRNFCPRCGKRTADLTVIHTCTPPEGGHQ